MDGPSDTWMEEEWKFLDPESLISPSNTQPEQDLWDNSSGIYPTETPGVDGFSQSIDTEGQLAADMSALDMGAAKQMEQSYQHMWLTTPELSHQYSSHDFSGSSINFESMGSHLLDDWPVAPEYQALIPLSPLSGTEPQATATNFSDWFGQDPLPFHQSLFEQNPNTPLHTTGPNGFSNEGHAPPTSLAVEVSSPPGLTGRRSSREYGQSSPNPLDSPEGGSNGLRDVQTAPERTRERMPKQAFSCSFSPCSRTFSKHFELR